MEPASLTAVRQVVDWAHEQGMTIRELLNEEQLEGLKRVFSNQEPWSFELYEPLRALSHALPRLDLPDVPARIHFGDCLSALDAVLQRDAASGAGEGAYAEGLRRYTWPLEHAVPSDVFETLGYAKASAGISALRAKHRAGWQQHAERSKAFLLRGAPSEPGGTAAIVGAGKLYDIPLKQLAERFERLLLVDVDGAALAESVEQVLGDSTPRQRIELVTSDVTGINLSFVRRVDQIFETASDEASTYRALLALLYSLRSAGPTGIAPTATLPRPLRAAFSSMVLSQLALPLTEYVERRFKQRFAGSKLLEERRSQVALAQFTHRLQHTHLQSLLGIARLVTLTSDISEQHTLVTPKGQRVSEPLALIGAPHLEDLVPLAEANVSASDAWPWQRLVPTATRPHGRRLSVNGCVVSTGW
jgi:hypothetical protein